MDIGSLKRKVLGFLKKYRYAALVLIIGLAFMLIPSGNEEPQSQAQITTEVKSEDIDFNAMLADILSQIDGAGKVQVLLTVSSGEETLYQTDSQTSSDADSNTMQADTVIVTDSEKNQLGLVRQINPPIYQGAIVVCQGADSSTVRLAIVEAVSKVTGLGADKISVLKMK